MQTSTRNRDAGASFAARKGHLSQPSISDENHHVTETIGFLYDDEPEQDPYWGSNSTGQRLNSSRPGTSTYPDAMQETRLRKVNSIPRKQIPDRNQINGQVIMGPSGHPRRSSKMGNNDWEGIGNNGPRGSVSTMQMQTPSETATSAFPLNDIDYESSPAAVAQELSNLQALRRMSMDVGATDDPDLPQISAAGIPRAPSTHADEDDASRLFWVPARLHPELAPKEFKSFLESRAEQIKRKSGELSAFNGFSSPRTSTLSLSTTDSDSSLRRRKSMLSHQIDNSTGYQDGADILERKREDSRYGGFPDPNLQELESIVSGSPRSDAQLSESPTADDEGDIILPSVPGSSLKRSTRTAYRRGGSLKGRSERGSYAQRATRKVGTTGDLYAAQVDHDDVSPNIPTNDPMDLSTLAMSLRDSPRSSYADPESYSYSDSGQQGRMPPSADSIPSSFDSYSDRNDYDLRADLPSSRKPLPISKSPPPPAPPPHATPIQNIPQIIETPPQDSAQDYSASSSKQQPPQTPTSVLPGQAAVRHPERVSSREDKSKRPGFPPKQSSMGAQVRPPSRGNVDPGNSKPPQSLEQPALLPGTDTNTNNLSFIPTLTVDKRADHKRKEETKKSSWGWLLGKEDGDKEKPDKVKGKGAKAAQQHDNTRLDVLQTSIDGPVKSRESFVGDRDSIKLEEERKKESQRKSIGSDTKKEKDGLFSSLFGGKKGKAEKEGNKRFRDRLSPEPVYRELKPDIDYNWTRFSILEERAIYRMAHIKLANPRRALHSQVLLSNFMYSYLAKVQQMHPQMNLPTSAKQQRRQQQQAQQQQKDQAPEEYQQYQRYQQHQAQMDSQQQSPTAGSSGSNSSKSPSDNKLSNQQSYSTQQDFDDSSSNMYTHETQPTSNTTPIKTSNRPNSRGGNTVSNNVNNSNNRQNSQIGGSVNGASGGGGGGSTIAAAVTGTAGAGVNYTGNQYHHNPSPNPQTSRGDTEAGSSSSGQHQQVHYNRYGSRATEDDDDDDMW